MRWQKEPIAQDRWHQGFGAVRCGKTPDEGTELEHALAVLVGAVGLLRALGGGWE